jgi:hypothetical protein
MHPTVYCECLAYVARRDGLAESDLRPVLASDVLTIEHELGAQLPEQYEDFLRSVGVGCEYGGLSWWWHLDVTRPGNLLEKNHRLVGEQLRELRKMGLARDKYPAGFLAIYDPCDGEVFGFLRCPETCFLPKVVAWDTEEFTLSTVAPDFNHFLDYLADCDPEELEQARQQSPLISETFSQATSAEDLFH